MTGKQRAYLRSLAQTMSPIFQIGKSGVTEETNKQLSNALEARELIKVHVLDTADVTAREAAELVAEDTGSEVVTVIGTKFVLYRMSSKKDNRKIDLSAVR